MHKKNTFVPFLMWATSLYFKEGSLEEQAVGKDMLWLHLVS